MILHRAVVAAVAGAVICLLGSFALARLDASAGFFYGLGLLCTTLAVVRIMAPHVGFDRPPFGRKPQVRPAPRSGHHTA